MLLFGFLLVPLVLAETIELTTNDCILKIDDKILKSIQITNESSNDLNLSSLDIHGIDDKVFENLRDVKNLNLSNNSLSILPSLVFSHFEGLDHLSLADNVIERFDGAIFVGLNNLKTLDISNNSVRHLGESHFFGLGKSTNILTLGNDLWYINTRLFVNSDLEDELFEMLNKEEAERTTENYIKPSTPETLTEYRDLDESLKVKVCIREGNVEKLEAFNNTEDLESHCTEVEILHLSRTVSLVRLGISKFTPGWYRLQDYPIDNLHLQGNDIVDVSAEVLNDLPKGLDYVNLANNKIERLAEGTIVNEHLRELNLWNNSISEIEDGAFENMKLSYLYLTGNRLRNTSFVASLKPTLKVLSLGENRIDEITPESFSRLNNLLYLDISDNNITAIKSESLHGLTSLDTIALSNNNMKSIEPDSLRDLKALRILDLLNNNLTSLEKGVFNGLESIEKIHLQFNNLTKITNDSLHGLSKTLKELHLHGNQIEILEYGTFINVPKDILSLSSNKIKKIANGAFNLPTLERLFLDGNLLSQVDGDSFVSLGRLRYLYLKNNGITRIEKGIVKNLSGLFSLDISNNPIKRLENGALFGMPKSKGTEVQVINLPLELIQGGVFDDL